MARTISRPQAAALRAARNEGHLTAPDFPAGHPLHNRYALTIGTRANTRDALVRLGMVEGITHTEAGDDVTDYVLTYAGELIALHCDDVTSLPTLGMVEHYAANGERPEGPHDGTYQPSAEGARTLRDAHPLWLNGQHVTAAVEGNGTRLYVFLGTEMIYAGAMPTSITTAADVNPWVRQYATGYVWAAEYRTLWSYRDHAGHIWGPYADREFAHTDSSAERYCRGIVDTVGAGEVIRIDRTPTDYATTGRHVSEVRTVVHVAGTPAQESAQAPASAPVTVWATTGSGERINYAHVPNGDPARVAAFLADARAVPHFRDVSTTR